MKPIRTISFVMCALITLGGIDLSASEATEEALGNDGNGQRISILSDGFLTEHEAFILTDNEAALSKEESDSLFKSTNAAALHRGDKAAESAYVNEKIPFAYDYGDGDNDVFNSNNSDIGTAMISIAAGNGKVADTKGEAPEAQIFAMKVYSDTLGAVSYPAMVSAVEDSLILGADVILITEAAYRNLPSAEETALLESAFIKAKEAGVAVICPAGDCYGIETAGTYAEYEFELPTTFTDVGTIAYPASSEYVFCVGNAVDNRILSPAISLAGGQIIPFSDTNHLYTATNGKSFSDYFDGQTIGYTVIDGVGTKEQFSAAGSLKGQFAVVDRGEISFTEKAQNAYAVGAAGVIVVDTQTNEAASLETMLDLTDAPIPVILVSMLGGRYLEIASERSITVKSGLAKMTEIRETPSLSRVSAVGTTPTLSLKPDVCVVGTDVGCIASDGSYVTLTSTAASAAKAAGMYVTVRSRLAAQNPQLDAQSLMSLTFAALVGSSELMNTNSGSLYSPRYQGGGAASSTAASNASLVLTSNGGHKIELGEINGAVIEFSVTAANISDLPKKCTIDAVVGSDGYKVYSTDSPELSATQGTPAFSEIFPINGSSEVAFIEGFTEFPEAKIRIGDSLYELNRKNSGYSPYTFTLMPGASETFNFRIIIDSETMKNYGKYFTNGFFAEGFVSLAGEDEVASIPFVGYCGSFGKMQALDGDILTDDFLYYNGTELFRFVNDVSVNADGKITLGAKASGKDRPSPYEQNAMAFSPVIDSENCQLFLNFSLLRTVTDVKVTVTDSNELTVYEKDFGTVFRTVPLNSAGISRSETLPIWDGRAEDHYGYIYPDGEYTVTVSFRKPSSSLTESLSYKLLLDTEAPELRSYDYTMTDTEPIISVDAYDLSGIRRVDISDSRGRYALQNDDGSYDLTGLIGEYLYIDITDNALNYRVIKMKNPVLPSRDEQAAPK